MAKRILIADDEPNIVVSLEFLMKQRGYDIRVVSDGAEALARGRRVPSRSRAARRDDAAVSGYDVCQKVRENPAWNGIRIVMLSAKGRDVEVTQGPGGRRRRLRHEAVLHARPDREGRRDARGVADARERHAGRAARARGVGIRARGRVAAALLVGADLTEQSARRLFRRSASMPPASSSSRCCCSRRCCCSSARCSAAT